MVYSQVPSNTKSQVNKAGDFLAKNSIGSNKYNSSLELAEGWRACHAYPLNTFNVNLRRNIKKVSGGSIVAQRLKRMPTIIDKLKRYHAMKLTTMQDIGGVRAIVNNTKDVYELVNIYRNHSSNFLHQLYNEKDYIG